MSEKKVFGLDIEKLMHELKLNEDELLRLLSFFLKSMEKTIFQLQNAINDKDYKEISHLAHRVKGASGNFRIKTIQDIASDMEKMSEIENETYDYGSSLNTLKTEIRSITIE